MHRSASCVLAVCLLAALASCDARSLTSNGRSLLSMSAAQVIANIQSITDASASLQPTVKEVVPPTVGTDGVINVPTNYFQLSQQIQQGLQTIAQLGTNAIQEMNSNPLPAKFSDADGTNIFNAFKTFVAVHQELLSILIGKRGIISNIPFAGQGIAAALRAIENVVDTIAYGLIDTAQNVSGPLTTQFNNLDLTLTSTINDYANPIPDPTALTSGVVTVG